MTRFSRGALPTWWQRKRSSSWRQLCGRGPYMRMFRTTLRGSLMTEHARDRTRAATLGRKGTMQQRHDELFAMAALLVAGGCASTRAPPELTDARAAYERLRTTDASIEHADQDSVRAAKTALDIAEASYLDDPGSQETRDLAIVAKRKLKLAEANVASAPAPPGREQADAAPERDHR